MHAQNASASGFACWRLEACDQLGLGQRACYKTFLRQNLRDDRCGLLWVIYFDFPPEFGFNSTKNCKDRERTRERERERDRERERVREGVRERERGGKRERERERYIYIYMERDIWRERERWREIERERDGEKYRERDG